MLTTEAVDIKVGAAARIERWGGDDPLAARAQRKQPSAYTTRSALGVEEQRVPVVLDLIEDPARWTALGDGRRVEAHIRVARVENARAVPASALFREAEGWAVFAVRDGKAQRRVEIGVRTADWAEGEARPRTGRTRRALSERPGCRRGCGGGAVNSFRCARGRGRRSCRPAASAESRALVTWGARKRAAIRVHVPGRSRPNKAHAERCSSPRCRAGSA